MEDNLTAGLNQQQKEAVLYFDSPLLIIAGAGSGKTKVITHKIAYLIKKKGLSPGNILGVTFTNKAAAEMKKRIEALTDIQGFMFNISTFHSLGLKILRESGADFQFSADWQILNDNDQKKILDRIIKENFSSFTNEMRDSLRKKISRAKMHLLYPNNEDALYEKGMTEDEVAIYKMYFKEQKANKVWDFEDLISLPVKMLESSEELRQKYQEKFRYLVVDEFQDTNPNQYQLIKLISGKHKNITIVGDDDQAIYSWRGANIRFLSDFEHDYSPAKIIKLEQNYRSTEKILKFANCLIKNNMLRKDKAMWTDKQDGNDVFFLNTISKEDEARKVADFIKMVEKIKPEMLPVAILYRINSQSLSFETEFAKRNISFKILKGLRFFDRKEIRDSLALLKMTCNPDDNIAFMRMIDFLPLGIGPKTLTQIENMARENELSLFNALKDFFPDKFKSREIFLKILRYQSPDTSEKYSEILTSVLNSSGYLDTLHSKNEDSRIMNINELVEFIKKWEEDHPDQPIKELFDSITLDSDDVNSSEPKEKVFLLTMHNAKGMEFNTVVSVGINSSYMPFFLRKNRSEIEEERRLFYVAATRAINTLVVSSGGDTVSKFMKEINYSLFRNEYSSEDIMDALCSDRKKVALASESENVRMVEHPFFGIGSVKNDLGSNKFLIDFKEKGEKTIDTSIVKLKFL